MLYSVVATKVQAINNHQIQVWFSDSRVTRYDVAQDIKSIRAFSKLSDPEEFQKVYLLYGGRSIAWGDGDEFTDPSMDIEVPYDEGEVI